MRRRRKVSRPRSDRYGAVRMHTNGQREHKENSKTIQRKAELLAPLFAVSAKVRDQVRDSWCSFRYAVGVIRYSRLNTFTK